MSLSISIGEKQINWLRNPFGLPFAVQGNLRRQHSPSLNDVCNKWTYRDSANIDRQLFKQTVDWYAKRFCALKQIYIVFEDESSLKQFLPNRKAKRFPVRYKVEVIAEAAEIQYRSTLDYQNWMRELQQMASDLQNEANTFYCSN